MADGVTRRGADDGSDAGRGRRHRRTDEPRPSRHRPGAVAAPGRPADRSGRSQGGRPRPTLPGRFFADDGDDAGFVVSNADGVPFLTAYYRLGGPPAVGLPITHRLVHGGLVTQAFERLVL